MTDGAGKLPVATSGLHRVVDDPVAASIAGITALLVASALVGSGSMLVAAFGGGAAYAAASLLLAARPVSAVASEAPRRIGKSLLRHATAFCTTYALLFAASLASDAPHAFFCADVISWSPEVFAAGAYVLAVLAGLSRRRGHSTRVHVLWIGVAWIAPWYGFFSIATVSGAGLALGCEGRGLSDYAYLAMLGTAASATGSWLGQWLGDGLSERPINPYRDL